MGVSRVDYNGKNLVDLSNDTVTPETLAEGMTAHNANGDQITGTMPKTGSEAVQEIMLVTANFSFANMQATNLSHSYDKILSAVANENKLVKIAVSYALPGQTIQNTAIGDLVAIIPTDDAVQFGLFMRANLGTGYSLYYFSIYVYNTNNVMTNIQLISSTNVGG